MPALERPLCTVEDIAAETRNDNVGSLPDINNIINSSSRLVESMTNRLFWFYDHTVTNYAVPRKAVVGAVIRLPFPIVMLDEVSLDGRVMDASEYVWDEGHRLIYRVASGVKASWSSSVPFLGAINLKGTFGYPLDVTSPTDTPPPTLPPEIRKAAALTASAWTGEYEVERQSFDGSRETVLETHVPDEARRLLKAFQPLTVGNF